MDIRIIIISLLSLAFTQDCGKERTDVKTLTDIEARKLSYRTSGTTIKRLRSILPHFPIGGNLPRQPEEKRTYSVICNIREFRQEEDGDFHLVLTDLKDSALTMIGEIPDPECDVMSDCVKLEEIRGAYNAFYSEYRLPNHKVKSGKYKISGVFFFDKIHGQLGVAPNGAELHPVLSIKKID